jgi:hypothetical protein
MSKVKNNTGDIVVATIFPINSLFLLYVHAREGDKIENKFAEKDESTLKGMKSTRKGESMIL